MPEFNFSVIYLGNMVDLDPTDGNGTAENQSALLGSYYSADDPAAGHITTLTAQDANSDNRINSNDTGSPEAVSYDLGAGVVNTQYDALFNADVTVNFVSNSGEPAYNGLGGIIQTEAGDLFFVMIDDGEGFGSNAFDDFAIESISINSILAFGSQSLATASDTQSFVPCFAAGTQIRSQDGDILVEDISVGDWVETIDNGYQRVTWVGRRYVPASQIVKFPNLGPVYITSGSLGNGCPEKDLVVSHQHRIMLRSKITQRMFDHSEILVPAVNLLGFPGIQKLNCGLGVQYHHFACASHEVIWANGAPAETFLAGPEVRKTLSPIADVHRALATSLADDLDQHEAQVSVRPIIQRQSLTRAMLERHIKNDMPLVTL